MEVLSSLTGHRTRTSQLQMQRKHPESLLKGSCWNPSPRNSDTWGLKWGPDNQGQQDLFPCRSSTGKHLKKKLLEALRTSGWEREPEAIKEEDSESKETEKQKRVS